VETGTSPRACRRGLRYPSDLTECEWALVEPLIPPAKRGGRRRTIDVREVLNAIFYVLSTGCQWTLCQRTCRPRARCTIVLTCGIGTAHWSASTTPFMLPPASRRGGKPARA
jgi:hypothetical protein